MNWLKDLVGAKKEAVRRAAPHKHTATAKKASDKKFHVRLSDKKIFTAHKSPSGTGYVYKSRGTDGMRNVHINTKTYSSQEEAKKKVEKLKKADKPVKTTKSK